MAKNTDEITGKFDLYYYDGEKETQIAFDVNYFEYGNHNGRTRYDSSEEAESYVYVYNEIENNNSIYDDDDFYDDYVYDDYYA